MDLKIKNKVCIITGGAKGIGYGIAKLWASEGGIPVIFQDLCLKSTIKN